MKPYSAKTGAWQIIISGFEAYVLFAVIAYIWWDQTNEYVFPYLGLMYLGASVSFVGLLVGGIILLARHKLKAGSVALIFALLALFFYGIAIPTAWHY